MDIQVLMVLGLTGAIVGFMAGLLGLGGGLLMVPVLSFLLANTGVAEDLSIKMAIVTSMSTILFTSISSVRTHHKLGAVRWDLVKGLAPGIVIGSALASLWIFVAVKGATLAILFGVFVSYSAFQMFMDKKPKPSRQMPGFAGQLGMGGLIGMLSGLVGAGGAFVSVPLMTWCNVAIHNAIGTSAALGFPIALANVTGFVISGLRLDNLPPGSFGYIWLPGMVVIACFSVFHGTLWCTCSTPTSREEIEKGFFIFLGIFGLLHVQQRHQRSLKIISNRVI